VNKLVISTIAGILFSLAIAFAIIYTTSTMVQFGNMRGTKTSITATTSTPPQQVRPYIFNLNVSTLGNNSKPLLIQDLNLSNNIVVVPKVNFTSSYTLQPQFYSNTTKLHSVFYVTPTYIEAEPNSTIYFYLFLNNSYLNDPVYTYYIQGYTKNVSVTFVQNISNFQMYNVTIKLGNIKSGTIILLPVWDVDGYEVEYVVIFII
jgi:hypothetical protein